MMAQGKIFLRAGLMRRVKPTLLLAAFLLLCLAPGQGLADWATGEFHINQTPIDQANQSSYKVSLVGLRDGGWGAGYVAYVEKNGITNWQSMYLRWFDNNGAPVSDEYDVGEQYAGQSHDPSLCQLTGGDMLFKWEPSYDYIFARRYQPLGGPTTDTMTLWAEEQRQYTLTSYSCVAALTGGGYALAWSESNSQTGLEWEVFIRVFNENDQAITHSVKANTLSDNYQHHTRITALANGGFAVLWRSDDTRYGGEAVYARAFNAQGQPVCDPIVVRADGKSTECSEDPEITGLSDGGFMVSYRRSENYKSRLYGMTYDENGALTRGEFAISSSDYYGNVYDHKVAALTGGGYAVVWQNHNWSGQSIYLQLLDQDLNANGSTKSVNQNIYERCAYPQVAALSTGGFVATFMGKNSSDETYLFLGRIYSSDE